MVLESIAFRAYTISRKSKKGHLFDFLQVGGATVVSAAGTFMVSVVLKLMINPEEYGYFVIAGLFLSYGMLLQFGVLNGINRLLPYRLGQGDEKGALSIIGTAFTFILTIGFLIVAAATIVLMFIGTQKSWDNRLLFGLLLNGFVLISSNLYNLHQNVLKGFDDFRSYARYEILRVFLYALTSILFTKWLGYWGMYIGNLFSFAFTAIAINLNNIKVRLSIYNKLLRELISVGLPIMLNSFLWTVVLSINTIVIVTFFNAEQLGYYHLAMTVYSSTMLIPNALMMVLYPKLSNMMGRTNDNVELLTRRIDLLNRMVSWLSAGLFILSYLVILPLFHWLLPAYRPGIAPSKVILFGVYFLSVTLIYNISIIMINRQVINMRLLVGMCILNAFLSWVFAVHFKMGIYGVAFGTASSYFLYYVSVISVFLHHIGHTWHKVIGKLITYIIPIITIALPVLIIDKIHLFELAPTVVGLVMMIAISTYVLRNYKRLWEKL